MQKNNRNREDLFKYLSYTIGLVVLAYSTYRAVVLGITHDEASTYVTTLPLSVWEVVSYQVVQSANNHILNTLLMKASVSLFGSAEWALRLPNLFGHFLFILFSIRIVKSTLSWTYLGFLTVILLNFNPYLLDFFSVARGYGLAIGMMMASVYFFLHHLKSQQLKYWILSLFFGFLAVWANFIYLIFFVALVAIYFILELERYLRSMQTFKALLKGQVTSLIGTLFLAAVITVPILKLRALKEFRYGGNSSFYQDTYVKLLEFSLHGNKYFGADTVKIFSILILVLLASSGLLILFQHLKNKKPIMENAGLLLLLFGTFIVVISVAQHYLLGAAYLTYRRSTIFLPFAALVLCYGLQVLRLYSKKMTSLFAIIIMLFSSYHFVYNTRYYLSIQEWVFDRDTKEVLEIIKTEVATMNKPSIKIQAGLLMRNGFNFYRVAHDLDWLERIRYKDVKVKGEGADFYYIFERERPRITDQVDTLYHKRGRILLRSLSTDTNVKDVQ